MQCHLVLEQMKQTLKMQVTKYKFKQSYLKKKFILVLQCKINTVLFVNIIFNSVCKYFCFSWIYLVEVYIRF